MGHLFYNMLVVKFNQFQDNVNSYQVFSVEIIANGNIYHCLILNFNNFIR